MRDDASVTLKNPSSPLPTMYRHLSHKKFSIMNLKIHYSKVRVNIRLVLFQIESKLKN